MAGVKLKGNIYELPLGSLYINEFDCVKGEILYFDDLSVVDRCSKLDQLFGWVSRSLCSFDEDEFYPSDLIEEKQSIRSRVYWVDNRCKRLIIKDNYEKAIEVFEAFLIDMLEHYKKLVAKEEKTLGGV